MREFRIKYIKYMYDKNIGMYFRHVDIIGISFSSQFEFFN